MTKVTKDKKIPRGERKPRGTIRSEKRTCTNTDREICALCGGCVPEDSGLAADQSTTQYILDKPIQETYTLRNWIHAVCDYHYKDPMHYKDTYLDTLTPLQLTELVEELEMYEPEGSSLGYVGG